MLILQRAGYLLTALFFVCACQGQNQPASKTTSSAEKKEGKQTLLVQSPAFEEGGRIPAIYTCDDRNISPPLSWSNVPDSTKSLALICDDPDAPAGTWVHWVLFNIPPDTTALPENMPPEEQLENGAEQGQNDFGEIGYGGPCPPRGTHRYYFRLYALDKKIDIESGATRQELMKAMKGHVMAEGQLMGRYSR